MLKLAALSFAVSTTSMAQEDTDQKGLSLKSIFDLSVVTASRLEESASKAPGTIYVITDDQISLRGYRYLDEVLSDIPGFYVQNASDAVTYNRITVRGIKGNNKFVILQNGIRISSPTAEDIPIAENFPLYNVKQVEVVYGPASALYGADAFTGVINLITKKAGEEHSQSVALGGGENNNTFVNAYGNYRLSEKVDLSLGINHEMGDNGDLKEKYPDKYPNNNLDTFGGDTIIEAETRKDPHFPTTSRHMFANLNFADALTLAFNRSDFSHPSVTGTRPDTANYNQTPQWRSIINSMYLKYSDSITEDIRTEVQFSFSTYQISPESKFANIFTDYEDGYEFAES